MTDKPSNVVPFRAAKADRGWFSVRAAADGKPAVVEVYDEIGFWGRTAKELISELQAIDGEGLEVEIRLNSPGGDVFEGVAISTAIGRMKARTVAVVDGIAASMASLVAVSCDAVKMPANTMMMIHRPWTVAIGEAGDLRATADVLDKMEEQFVAAYAAKADRTLGAEREGAEDFAALVAAETWLTADECVALGLADEILEPVRIAACVRPDLAKRFANAEAVEPFLIEEEATAEADEAAEDEPTEAVEEVLAEPVAEEPAALDDEACAAIQAACAAFDAADRAEGFIAARANIDTVRDELRAAFLAARAKADEALETDAKIAPAEESAERPETSRSLSQARRAGLNAMRGQR